MSASKRPFVLGLTGGIASGKSEAASLLEQLGAYIVDADVISRTLTGVGGALLPAIRAEFGDTVFLPDGRLDRRALGDIVFQDEDRRIALETIMHPGVQRRMLLDIEQAAQSGVAVCVLVVPLLFECGLDTICDEVWVTAVDAEPQIARLMARDRLSREQALQRINSQMPQQEREGRADLIIHTNRPLKDTQKEVRRHFEALLRRLPN